MMVEVQKFISLLNQYGINAKKIIEKKPNVLEYAHYDNAENIIIYLQSLGIPNKSIEKCPSILSMQSVEVIKQNYHYLIKETILESNDIKDNLSILNTDHKELKDIYNYVLIKYGENIIKKTPGIVSGNYQNIIEITEFLEQTIGLDIIKNNGSSILKITTKSEMEKILTIPEFQYNPFTKKI